MRRREFVGLLGGAAAWPLAARAQQDGRVRRVGMLSALADNDPQFQARVETFRETLAKLGWIEGRNLRIDLRFGTVGDTERMRMGAVELVNLSPDVIVANNTLAIRALRQHSETIPLVFTTISDPVTTGVVGNLARPEGNATGFPISEPSIAGKWLQLLKEAAPHVDRVAHVFDPANAPETYFASIEAAAHSLAVEAIKLPIRDILDVVRSVDAFAAKPNGGMLLTPDPTTFTHRETIGRLVVQHRLPTIYWGSYLVREGGLMAYSADLLDQYRGAASYVDRILHGTKVSDLPVQFPTKFELVVNLRTAKAMGLTIPETFLLRADELIE